MGGAKAHYDGIVAFSQTDFTEDLKKITVPVLVMHSEDDQIVPYVAAGPLVGEAFEERDAEDLQGLPARHADHGSGHDQRRPAGLPEGVRSGQQAASGWPDAVWWSVVRFWGTFRKCHPPSAMSL